MVRVSMLVLCTLVAEAGCSTTRLAPAVKAYGTAVSASSAAIGDNGATLRRALRYQRLGDLQQSTEPLSGDYGHTFLCSPLDDAFTTTIAQSTMSGLGDRLGDVAGASPDTLVELYGALRDDYAADLTDAKPGETADEARARRARDASIAQSRLTTACEQVYDDAFAQRSDTLARLEGLHPLTHGGAPAAAGPNAVFSTLRDILIAFGQIVDQQRRNQALRDYFNVPKNIEELQAAEHRLDLSLRIAELGARAAAQQSYRAAWNEYSDARAASLHASNPHEAALRLQTASTELVNASADMDGMVAGLARDLAFRDIDAAKREATGRCLDSAGLPRDSTSDEVQASGCWYSALGQKLDAATQRLRHAVLLDGALSPEDREALALSIGEVIKSYHELADELAPFENDHESFNQLRALLGRLPRSVL